MLTMASCKADSGHSPKCSGLGLPVPSRGKMRSGYFRAESVREVFGGDFMNCTHIPHGVKKETPTLNRQAFKPIFRSPIPAFEI